MTQINSMANRTSANMRSQGVRSGAPAPHVTPAVISGRLGVRSGAPEEYASPAPHATLAVISVAT